VRALRRNVAIAIDGGGLRGIVPARALAILEDHLGSPCGDVFRLAAGTSTGSILSAGIAVGLSARRLHALYRELGHVVFRKSWRTYLWPLTRYRYSSDPLEQALRAHYGDLTLGELWGGPDAVDLVITTFDLAANRTRFVKPWKPEYADWSLVKAVLASCCVPTLFPVVEGRYVDGGVGSYTNPCYLAAYEAVHCLRWDPAETTIISLGTGRLPHDLAPGRAARFWAWDWIGPVLGAFLQSADDQQVHLVDWAFGGLDFRRFQVQLETPIPSDDPARVDELTAYGDILGAKILNDETEPPVDFRLEPSARSGDSGGRLGLLRRLRRG